MGKNIILDTKVINGGAIFLNSKDATSLKDGDIRITRTIKNDEDYLVIEQNMPSPSDEDPCWVLLAKINIS